MNNLPLVRSTRDRSTRVRSSRVRSSRFGVAFLLLALGSVAGAEGLAVKRTAEDA